MRKIPIALLCGCFLVFLCHASAFSAEASIFAVNEVAGRGRSFTLAGIDVTQPLNSHLAVSARILPNYLTYKYKYFSGDSPVQAKAPGLYALGGVKLRWQQTTFSVFAGVEARNTTLSPDDVNAEVRGNTLSGSIQAEIDSWIQGKTNIYLFSSYSDASRFWYEKGKIRRQISNLNYTKPCSLLIGIEQFAGGNAEYRNKGIAGSIDLYHIRHRVSIGARGGILNDSIYGNAPFWGLQFYKGF